MRPQDINIYSALRFEGRPDLHMTLRYWKKTSPCGLANRIRSLDKLLTETNQEQRITQFMATFDRPELFGWANKVRVLRAPHRAYWPWWLQQLMAPCTIANLHVTCEDEGPLELKASSIAIMRKKEVICQWKLAPMVENQPKNELKCPF